MGGEYTDAQSRATQKYIRERTDQIMVRVPKGEKVKIQEYVDKNGYESMNQFMTECIAEKMSKGSR